MKTLLTLMTGALLLLLPMPDGFAQAADDDDDDKPKVKVKDRVSPVATPRGPLLTPANAQTSDGSKSEADEGDDDDDDDDQPAPPPPQPDDEEDEPEPWRGDPDKPASTADRPARKTVEPLPGDVKINIDYNEVEIKEIIKDFAHKTGRNFLVDGKISGKITIHAPRAVTVDEAYEAFIIALDAAGYTTVVEAKFKSGPNRGKPMLTRILPAGVAKSEPLELYRSGRSIPNTAHLITRLVQLDNVSADEMSKILQKWVSKEGDIVAYPPSNMLIITDSANNIRRMLELVEELDISAPQQKLEVIKIEWAEASQVLSIVQEIYGVAAAQSSTKKSTSSAASRAAERRAARRNKNKDKTTAGTAASGSASTVGEQSSFISKMIADERTNSIIVLATEKSIEEIRELIGRIDYEVDPTLKSDIHVIYLEHAKAEELSSTLNSLVQQSNTRNTQRGRTGRTTGSDRGGATTGGDRRNRDRQTGSTQRPGQAGSLGGDFSGEVRVTHDVPTNSLVVTASRDDYGRLKRVIDMLDIPRKQVFVETVIMEVSDTRINDNGVSWHGGVPGSTNDGSPVTVIGARGSSSISPAASLLDGSLLAGLGLGIFGEAINVALPGVEGGLDIPAFGVVLRFLQEDTATNVLSSPNILTLDNEEATIEIGETVPFPTGGFLGGLGGATGATGGFGGGLGGIPSISFTREDVGIILRLTPQINESDWVTLDIYQEISEVKEGSTTDTLSSGGPTTTKRSAETHVSVRSNQTVVIGGLMQEVETESESKIPVLGDIPLLGALFRNKRKTKRKTNLLIFLTPHVIDTPEDLQEVYTIKMLQREEFMRRFYGKTPAEQAAELNSLIRYSMNLPGQQPMYSDPGPPREDVTIGELDDAELESILDELDTTEDEVLITPDGEILIEDEGENEDEDEDEGDNGDDEDLDLDAEQPE